MTCPFCSMEVEDVDMHMTEMAEKGDQAHKDAMETKDTEAGTAEEAM